MLVNYSVNSLAPGGYESNFQANFTDRWGISRGIALERISLGLTDYKSILVQAMAWQQTIS